MTQKYLKTRDVCKKFDVSIQAVYGWRKLGMPYIGSGKLLFYVEEDVMEWLNNRDCSPKVREKISSAEQVKEVIEKNYPPK